ncbi:MAG: hypothetical protein JWO52_5923, partial [Gammaproteobacteria bacterium]|nr:hypothetical protein [Gammaproteobacteria bacterium]
GRARARFLDVSDVDAPQLARDIVPPVATQSATRIG